ncbi:hypothetical protein [Streptomyces sp. NPDC101234]|uniref:hypothetical protein n=1 Tax=Streptomyces sp. NPDC101234 TaxID=3366138 RepID=UPI00381A6287
MKYGFGAGQAPAGAGDVEAVFDQVAVGAFDDSGGDRPAAFQGGVVAQVFGFAGQVVHGLVDALAFGAAQLGGTGGGLECGGGLLHAAGQEGPGVAGDPGLGGGVVGLVQAPGRSPQVAELSPVRRFFDRYFPGRDVVAMAVTSPSAARCRRPLVICCRAPAWSRRWSVSIRRGHALEEQS